MLLRVQKFESVVLRHSSIKGAEGVAEEGKKWRYHQPASLMLPHFPFFLTPPFHNISSRFLPHYPPPPARSGPNIHFLCTTPQADIFDVRSSVGLLTNVRCQAMHMLHAHTNPFFACANTGLPIQATLLTARQARVVLRIFGQSTCDRLQSPRRRNAAQRAGREYSKSERKLHD